MMMRMSKMVFNSEEWYKLNLAKPVRFFSIIDTPRYKYAYLIGNRLILNSIITESSENEIVSSFANMDWSSIKSGVSMKMQRDLVAVHGPHYRAVQSSTAMLVDWESEIAAFTFNQAGQLIVAENSFNTICIYEISVGILLTKTYKLDLDVKKLSYCKFDQNEEFLLVMPYDNHLYMLNLAKDEVCAFKGHRSYITQAQFTEKKTIVTGGCDHRIGLKKLSMVKKWQKIGKIKEEVLEIQSDKVEKEPFS